MSALPISPGTGHNLPPEDDPWEEIERLRARVAKLESQIDRLVETGMVALAGQRAALIAPRRKALSKYRRTHKAVLTQRQRQYRYQKAAEKLEREAPLLAPQQLARRRRRLEAQYRRVLQHQ